MSKTTVLDATHCYDGQLYKFAGTYTKRGNPEYVRWIKSRGEWAKNPRAYAITDEHKLR